MSTPDPLLHLPATRNELARAMGVTPKQASATLYYYQRRKLIAPTGNRRPNGMTGRGANNSPVWDLIAPHMFEHRNRAVPTLLNASWTVAAPVVCEHTSYEDWAVYVLV